MRICNASLAVRGVYSPNILLFSNSFKFGMSVENTFPPVILLKTWGPWAQTKTLSYVRLKSNSTNLYPLSKDPNNASLQFVYPSIPPPPWAI